jgi:hypothetical protein
MGKASSSKKIARAARAGGRASSVRQRNLMFPAAIGAIVLAGSAMVALAWNDHRDQASSVPPVANKDHWHAAYGFYICGEWQPAIPTYENPDGIHTHGDGVIHIHPFSSAAAGENARLKVFLDSAGVKLTDDELKIGDKTWKEGDDKCDGKDAELVVARWEHVQTTDKEPALLHSDFGDTRFRDDGEGFTIAFVPTDEAEGKGDKDIPKPESASQLSELGSVDTGQTSTDSTVPGETTVSTEPGETTVPTTAPEGGSTTTAAGGSTTTPETVPPADDGSSGSG